MHPARHFIQYLMTTTTPEAEDNEWIRDTLTDFGLFPKQAEDKTLNALRSELKMPKNYQPNSRTHQPSISFQKKHRIRDMHVQTPNAKKATEILNNSDAREKTEQLLLAYTPYAQVARQVNKTCRTRFRADAIALFYHYFFEVEAVARSTWTDIVRQSRKAGGLTYKAALSGQTDLVLWRMGESVIVQTRDALEEAFTQATMRMYEMRTMPTNMATVKMMQGLTESIVRVHQAMAESEVRMKDVLAQLQNFQQSRREMHLPSIASLGATSSEMDKETDAPMLPPPATDLN